MKPIPKFVHVWISLECITILLNSAFDFRRQCWKLSNKRKIGKQIKHNEDDESINFG